MFRHANGTESALIRRQNDTDMRAQLPALGQNQGFCHGLSLRFGISQFLRILPLTIITFRT